MWPFARAASDFRGVLSASSYRAFLRFAASVDLDLEPFQRKIAKLVLEGPAESVILLSRGNGKSRLMGTLAVFHLLTTPRASVFLAASSREQSSVVFAYARDVAQHPALDGQLVTRHLELRAPDGGRLRVLASDAPKLHGLTPSMAIIDELHAHRDDEVYLALRTAAVKRPGCRMVTISTAGQGADTPLGRLRTRCLAQPTVKVNGALTETRGPSLAMLDWSVPEDGDIDNPRVVKQANPASWLSMDALASQRDAVPDLAYRRYHANQWNAADNGVFPPGAWAACAGDPTIEDGAEIVIAIDAGKGASDSAVVWCDRDLNVGVKIIEGTGTAHEIDATVDDLARRYRIREVVADPWHVVGYLTEKWEQRGLIVVEYPQFDSRLVPATDRLHRAVSERRLTHPDDPALNRHLDGSMLRDTRRGVRLDKRPGQKNDGMIALLLAVDRAEQPEHAATLLGFV